MGKAHKGRVISRRWHSLCYLETDLKVKGWFETVWMETFGVEFFSLQTRWMSNQKLLWSKCFSETDRKISPPRSWQHARDAAARDYSSWLQLARCRCRPGLAHAGEYKTNMKNKCFWLVPISASQIWCFLFMINPSEHSCFSESDNTDKSKWRRSVFVVDKVMITQHADFNTTPPYETRDREWSQFKTRTGFRSNFKSCPHVALRLLISSANVIGRLSGIHERK